MVNALDATLVIGGDLEGNADFFTGMIDEIKIYSIGLPEISIQTIYDKSFFKWQALEEERERIRKVKIEIEEYRAKIIQISEELDVLEDIGSPAKGQEEAFLKLLK